MTFVVNWHYTNKERLTELNIDSAFEIDHQNWKLILTIFYSESKLWHRSVQILLCIPNTAKNSVDVKETHIYSVMLLYETLNKRQLEIKKK